jgi:hypothetical protein
MDGLRFDALTRSLHPGSRRGFVRTISALVGIAFGPLLARPDAAAKKGRGKKKCKRPCGPCAKCTDGKCKRKRDGTTCGEAGVCQKGACKCPDGKKYCTNSAMCAQCCIDNDCPGCTKCEKYPNGTCVERLKVCQGDPACVKPACEDRAWVCRNICCDSFAGEEMCGDTCCNSLLGQTCCGDKFCCNDNETCEAGKCVSKCADGRPRCGGVCCTAAQDCIDSQCVTRECTEPPPTCPPCQEPKCSSPGGPPGAQYYCEWTCDRYRQLCINGQCEICRPEETPCFDDRVDLYDCCTSDQYCTSCACCFKENVCCPTGDCCLPGKCAPTGGCFM